MTYSKQRDAFLMVNFEFRPKYINKFIYVFKLIIYTNWKTNRWILNKIYFDLIFVKKGKNFTDIFFDKKGKV